MSLANLQPNSSATNSTAPAAAAAPLRSPHIKTSLLEVTKILPSKPPCRIFFKHENEQPSGSFKLRGIGHLVKQSIEKAQRSGVPLNKIHVFASSGGNAGLAAAYSAQFYKVACTVVIPTIAKPVIQAKLKSYGAKVILYGKSINEADQYLKGMISKVGDGVFPVYCHPFDNPNIWNGHSSLVDELVEQVGPDQRDKLKGLVCSFGGGGLYNGLYQGMVNNNVSGNVLLIETAQAPTLNESIKANDIITLNDVNSLATSLACSYTTRQSLQYYQDTSSGVVSQLETIDDMDALRACIAYRKCCNKIVEPACGAALSVCYNRLDLLYKSSLSHLSQDDILVIVVCGGSCTTESDLNQFETMVKKSETKL
ncbi:uncharacterized protein LODBEIA_P44760 [Lodderomyces beijingensis]|uniref:L-serine ammonia-lyase n=1 Tax=Lodderomyces beijingensis TaxID=1775926 RepID=A0ABP0ZSC6_9ASCO